jgi:basic membrane protein A
VFLASKSVVDGEFKGGTDAVFDLENEGVAIGKMSPEVPQEFIDRMNEIKERLISGELTAPSTL